MTRLELIKELSEILVLLSDEDYTVDYIASRYLFDLYIKATEGE